MKLTSLTELLSSPSLSFNDFRSRQTNDTTEKFWIMTPDYHQNYGRTLKVDIIEPLPLLVLICLFCIDLAVMVQTYVVSVLYMLRVMYNSIFLN